MSAEARATEGPEGEPQNKKGAKTMTIEYWEIHAAEWEAEEAWWANPED